MTNRINRHIIDTLNAPTAAILVDCSNRIASQQPHGLTIVPIYTNEPTNDRLAYDDIFQIRFNRTNCAFAHVNRTTGEAAIEPSEQLIDTRTAFLSYLKKALATHEAENKLTATDLNDCAAVVKEISVRGKQSAARLFKK
jgi:uncharacterized surface protein with fasciclin (FAS1) repeats